VKSEEDFDDVAMLVNTEHYTKFIYVAAKATYIHLFALWQKGFFGPSPVKRGRTHIVLG